MDYPKTPHGPYTRAFDGDWFGRYTRPAKPVWVDTPAGRIAVRSVLEALWITVWIEIGWDVVYEPLMLTLEREGRRYRPDARVSWLAPPGQRTHLVEIKPNALTDREARALTELSRLCMVTAFAFYGKPWPGQYHVAQTVLDPRTGRVRLVGGGVLEQDRDGDMSIVFPLETGIAPRLVGSGEPFALVRAFQHAARKTFEPVNPEVEEESPQIRLPGIA